MARAEAKRAEALPKLPARMAQRAFRNRNNLRPLISHVLIPRGWRAAGQGQWVREHGAFHQRIELQPSRWNTETWLDRLESLRAMGAHLKTRK